MHGNDNGNAGKCPVMHGTHKSATFEGASNRVVAEPV
jgi:hypothetical protein